MFKISSYIVSQMNKLVLVILSIQEEWIHIQKTEKFWFKLSCMKWRNDEFFERGWFKKCPLKYWKWVECWNITRKCESLNLLMTCDHISIIMLRLRVGWLHHHNQLMVLYNDVLGDEQLERVIPIEVCVATSLICDIYYLQ